MTTAIETLPALLTPVETAKLLRTTPNTLSVWRCTKRYPLAYVKRGRSVLYLRDAVMAFLKSQTVTPGIED